MGAFSIGVSTMYCEYCMSYIKNYCLDEPCSLDNLVCTPTVPCKPTTACCGMKKKKESTMRDYPNVNLELNASDRPSDLSQAREALVSRLRDVRDEKDTTLRAAFFMDKPSEPKTAAEAIARIVAGKFQPIDVAKDEAKANTTWDYKWYRSIDWRTQPKDEAGYDTANAKLDEAYEDAKLTIRVLTEPEGLKAFKDFQAFNAVTLN